jgi:putative spermidine/putrescine transport system permease protein
MKKGSFFIVSLLIFLTPILILIMSSFAFSWRWPDLLPQSYSLRAWQVLLREPNMLPAMWMTMLIGGMVVLLNLLLALPAAKALAHYEFKGKSIIEGLLLLPILVPALAVAMGIHLSMIRLGWANIWWGVVLVHLIPTLPYSLRILRSGFDRLGTRWTDQARSLGVSPWRVFWTISVPFLLPSIRSMIILTFVISLSQYVLTFLIGGGSVVTLPLIYYPFLSSMDTAAMASFSLVFAMMPIVFLIITEAIIRLLIPGKQRLLRGDVK